MTTKKMRRIWTHNAQFAAVGPTSWSRRNTSTRFRRTRRTDSTTHRRPTTLSLVESLIKVSHSAFRLEYLAPF